MLRKSLSKDELISALRGCAAGLGRAPTLREFITRCRKKITRYDVHHIFGGYTKLLRACGLDAPASGRVAELRALFFEWAEMARRLGRLPTLAEYDRQSRYSVRPLLNRFGNWTSVPLGLELYAEQNGLAPEWADVLKMVAAHRRRHQQRAARLGKAKDEAEAARPRVNRPRLRTDRLVFGPPLGDSALAHGPTNELGVVFLFGALAGRLGFVVTHLQPGFPDCEAMRRIDGERWQRVRIEFEYESRNFLKHLHRAGDCDLIVCWVHNWPDCPLDVVELKSSTQQSAVSTQPEQST